ncbi:hypothetical protein BS47DRAFT_264433 [Hydnum rufescens UP504]|uniref:Carboxylesterase type B domain-containing protein n=1 Tax=Hydnum rufescens UP504 TaxID=1448309 RepID=A0A9P6DMH7_9AGAM|nr:hypothetical protein BS47DRAFT_264433 [Hydnum rufescens UP504]
MYSPRHIWLLLIILPLPENWVFNKPKSLSRTLNTLLWHYPDIPSLGSPYPSPARTPGSWDDNSRIFEPLDSNQFKRVSSIVGDLIFESGRRVQLDDLARAGVPVWNYRFMQPPGDGETNMGVYHASELQYVFARLADRQDAHGEISRIMSRAWIHFAHDLDPNGPELPSWPAFSLAKERISSDPVWKHHSHPG